MKWVWLIVLVVRVFYGVLVRTSFDPDEYWQAMEVAHVMVFKYGYLTWEWDKMIRSVLHPGVFAGFYYGLKVLGVDTPLLVECVPRVIQAILVTVSDYFLYKMSYHLSGREDVAKWTLFLQLSNWFVAYCITRTYSNSMETCFTIIALYFWVKGSFRTSLVLSAFNFIIRPTNAVLWIFFGVCELVSKKNSLSKKIRLLLDVVFIGIVVIGLACILDGFFYGEWTVVSWNFLKYNVIYDISSSYGTHSIFWYVGATLAIIGTYAPGLVISLPKATDLKLFFGAVFYIFFFSFLSHKELRFILPVVPIFLYYASYFYADIFENKYQKFLQAVLLLSILINIVVISYLGLFHQSGTISVMKHIQNTEEIDSVHFLMPCHSTPFYSHVHRNISMRILDCQPNFDNPDALEEQEIFYLDPEQYLMNLYEDRTKLPSFLVFYDNLLDDISNFLNDDYTMCYKTFHTHIKVTSKIGSYILGYCKTN